MLLGLLPGLLLCVDLAAIEISSQLFVLFQPEGLFQKLAGFFALGASKTMGFYASRTIARDNHIDRFQATPPT